MNECYCDYHRCGGYSYFCFLVGWCAQLAVSAQMTSWVCVVEGGVTFVMFNFKVNVGTCQPIYRPRVFLSMMLGLILFRGSACNISFKNFFLSLEIKTCFIYIYVYIYISVKNMFFISNDRKKVFKK